MLFYSILFVSEKVIPHVHVPLVSGFGVDPALHVDVFQEFDLVRSSAGVSQVQGFHNESRAYLFEGTSYWLLTGPLNWHVVCFCFNIRV